LAQERCCPNPLNGGFALLPTDCELARQNDPGCPEAALELAVVQRAELVELMDTGDELLRRLASQADKLTI
jgi:hypothetical protein